MSLLPQLGNVTLVRNDGDSLSGSYRLPCLKLGTSGIIKEMLMKVNLEHASKSPRGLVETDRCVLIETGSGERGWCPSIFISY